MAAELTDEQIDHVARDLLANIGPDMAPLRRFARAILAQATQGAEPVAWWIEELGLGIREKPHPSRNPEPLYRHPAPPPTAEVEKDAARWRAVKTRYAAALAGRFLPGSGFHSVKSREALDAWADAAHREIEAWDAMSEADKAAWFSQQAAALQSDQAQAGKGDGSSLAKEAPHG